METKPKGRRILAEGLVILVSILLAFFLEGWRADRELDRELLQELESVLTQLERNRDLVKAELASLERVRRGSVEIVRLLEAAEGRDLVSIADTLAFTGLVWGPVFNPAIGAIDALIASGRLAQISNPDVRIGLAGLDEVIADAVEEQNWALLISVQQLDPLLDELTDVPSFDLIINDLFNDDGVGISPQERAAGRAFTSYGTVSIPTDRRVKNAIRRRIRWLTAAVGEFESLTEYIDRLIALLAAELR